jgi:hypothetical protein
MVKGAEGSYITDLENPFVEGQDESDQVLLNHLGTLFDPSPFNPAAH